MALATPTVATIIADVMSYQFKVLRDVNEFIKKQDRIRCLTHSKHEVEERFNAGLGRKKNVYLKFSGKLALDDSDDAEIEFLLPKGYPKVAPSVRFQLSRTRQEAIALDPMNPYVDWETGQINCDYLSSWNGGNDKSLYCLMEYVFQLLSVLPQFHQNRPQMLHQQQQSPTTSSRSEDEFDPRILRIYENLESYQNPTTFIITQVENWLNYLKGTRQGFLEPVAGGKLFKNERCFSLNGFVFNGALKPVSIEIYVPRQPPVYVRVPCSQKKTLMFTNGKTEEFSFKGKLDGNLVKELVKYFKRGSLPSNDQVDSTSDTDASNSITKNTGNFPFDEFLESPPVSSLVAGSLDNQVAGTVVKGDINNTSNQCNACKNYIDCSKSALIHCKNNHKLCSECLEEDFLHKNGKIGSFKCLVCRNTTIPDTEVCPKLSQTVLQLYLQERTVQTVTSRISLKNCPALFVFKFHELKPIQFLKNPIQALKNIGSHKIDLYFVCSRTLGMVTESSKIEINATKDWLNKCGPIWNRSLKIVEALINTVLNTRIDLDPLRLILGENKDMQKKLELSKPIVSGQQSIDTVRRAEGASYEFLANYIKENNAWNWKDELTDVYDSEKQTWTYVKRELQNEYNNE